jgi:hypothetical protein
VSERDLPTPRKNWYKPGERLLHWYCKAGDDGDLMH